MILIFLLGFLPIIWFIGKGGVLIDGVDTNFPLDPWVWFQRRLFVWNSANGGSDFSSSTAGLFFHFIQVIPFKLGFSLQGVQIISLIFWFLLITLSAYWFAKIILPKNRLAQFIFVFFYTFNIYAFNTWENVKVANLSLLVSTPLGLSILILLSRKKISYSKALFLSILCGVVVSGTGINPAYFVSFFLSTFLFFLGIIVVDCRERKILKDLKDFVFVSLSIILVNLFWILPTANYVTRDVSVKDSITSIGFTNWVDSLSENTSILNVVRMQGAWDWYAIDSETRLPLYVPYANIYFHNFPFLLFSFLIPILAILSFFFVDKKKLSLYVSFALMMVLAIFMGSGTHPPTGYLFRWMSLHIPFFSLFRSPWYIFTPLLVLSYAGLVSLLIFSLKRRFRTLTYLLGATLIVGNIFYSYPLITGQIFRPGRPDTFYVRFPDYLFSSKKWLGQDESEGRIIGYPEDEIEQFDWGYRGVESILTLFSDKEVLFSSLNVSNSQLGLLTREFYDSLKKREIESALKIASKLKVTLIFEKRDQTSLSVELPDDIKELPKEVFGEWTFYRLAAPGKIYISNKFLFAYPYSKVAEVMASTDPSEILINHADSIVKDASLTQETAGNLVLAENSQEKTFNAKTIEYQFEIPKSGEYQPRLESYNLSSFGLNPEKPLMVDVDGKRSIWEPESQSDYVIYKGVHFNEGSHKIVLEVDNKNLISGGDFENGTVFEREGNGVFKIEEENGNNFLSIFNTDLKDSSAFFKVSPFDSNNSYFIKFKYKSSFGSAPKALVKQIKGETKIKVESQSLPISSEWKYYSFYYAPVNTTSEMSVGLLSPFTYNSSGTKVEYGDLSIYKVFNNRLIFYSRGEGENLAVPQVSYRKVSPVEYQGEVESALGRHVLLFADSYSPEWEIRLYDSNDKQINAEVLHFSSNLYENSWYIDKTLQNYKFKIVYKPQRLFNFGLFISLLTICTSIAILIKGVTKGRKQR